MNWKFHHATFVVDRAPELGRHTMTHGPWSGHRPFAYDLVRFLKPRTIVELGSAHGTSFFSFCQAVRDGGFDARCYAVDTWKGDPHTGFYQEEVYQALRAVAMREFPSIACLMRTAFDQALPSFEDGSVDVLHIDGYHTYEAVSHDYRAWYPKLAPYSAVLFHDITERMKDFGVYRLWAELADYPRLAFSHSHGLGVLFPKGLPDSLRSIWSERDAITAHYRPK